ncbi:MAG: 4Fe-4S dicluster domain-containing protein [Promethearchaeota archaeon]
MALINFKFRRELTQEIPDLLKCYQCGTCVAGCTANKYGGAYSPRQKILAASYGQKDILSEELWKCVACNNCNELCPQEVNPYDVLLKLKNITYRMGLVDESYAGAEELLINTGRILAVSAGTQSRRKRYGLKELKPIEELKILLKNEG